MPGVRWQLYDPITLTTYNFEINPNAGGSPQRAKTLTYQNTSAPDGKTIIFEGRDAVPKLSFSGVILSQAQYEAMITWFEKRHQVQLTDDLGRVMWVYITSFGPTRERARSYPYKHSYDMEAVILDWA